MAITLFFIGLALASPAKNTTKPTIQKRETGKILFSIIIWLNSLKIRLKKNLIYNLKFYILSYLCLVYTLMFNRLSINRVRLNWLF